jgi:hypothetical protein
MEFKNVEVYDVFEFLKESSPLPPTPIHVSSSMRVIPACIAEASNCTVHLPASGENHLPSSQIRHCPLHTHRPPADMDRKLTNCPPFHLPLSFSVEMD